MEQLPESKQINYVIEHFEQEVSKWTFCEYTHMIMILNDLYCTSTKPNKLIIANFPYKYQLKRGELKEDEYGTLKHTQQFLQINENLNHKCLMSKYKLLELTSKDSLEKILDENSTDDDSVEIAKMFQTRMIAIGS